MNDGPYGTPRRFLGKGTIPKVKKATHHEDEPIPADNLYAYFQKPDGPERQGGVSVNPCRAVGGCHYQVDRQRTSGVYRASRYSGPFPSRVLKPNVIRIVDVQSGWRGSPEEVHRGPTNPQTLIANGIKRSLNLHH